MGTAMKPPLLPRIDGELHSHAEVAAENSKEVNMLVSGVSIVMNASKESRRQKPSVPQKAVVAVESDTALQNETAKTAENSIPLKQEATLRTENNDHTATESIIPLKVEEAIPVKDNILHTEPVTKRESTSPTDRKDTSNQATTQSIIPLKEEMVPVKDIEAQKEPVTNAEIIVPLKEEGTMPVEVNTTSQIEHPTPTATAVPLEHEALIVIGSSAPLHELSATRTENLEPQNAEVTIPADNHAALQVQSTEPAVISDNTSSLKEEATIPAENAAPPSETVIRVELSPAGVMASTESEAPIRNKADTADVAVDMAAILVERGPDTDAQLPGQENVEAVAPKTESQLMSQIPTDSAELDLTVAGSENGVVKDGVDGQISETQPRQTLESVALPDKMDATNTASEVPKDNLLLQEVKATATHSSTDSVQHDNAPTATLPRIEAQSSSQELAENKDTSNPVDAGTIPSKTEPKRVDVDSVLVELATENPVSVLSPDAVSLSVAQDAAVVAPAQEHTNDKEDIAESSIEEKPTMEAVAEPVSLQPNPEVMPNGEHASVETQTNAPSDQQAHPLTSEQVVADSTIKDVASETTELVEANVEQHSPAPSEMATAPFTSATETSGATVDALSVERDGEETAGLASTKTISESIATIAGAEEVSPVHPPSSEVESKIEDTASVTLAADLKEKGSAQMEAPHMQLVTPSAATLESPSTAKVNHITHRSDPIGETMSRASSIETIEANPETVERRPSIPELKSEYAESDGAQKSPTQEPLTKTEVYVNVEAEASARVPEE
ncbi:hypothetical protein HDU81_005502 [Chytriomyces hyalinus]|nr:hypothetical protein HDU81_005502 [Chytriomyces hyalinus]